MRGFVCALPLYETSLGLNRLFTLTGLFPLPCDFRAAKGRNEPQLLTIPEVRGIHWIVIVAVGTWLA